MNNYETAKILGIDVLRISKDEALNKFKDFLNDDKCSHIVTLNPEMIIEAQTNTEFKALLDCAELVFPDGIGVVYASKLVGSPVPERITGIDFSRSALEILGERGGSAYFLGAKPGIAEAAAKKISEEISGLRIVGYHDGYFKSEDEEALIDEINASGADMLCLALGAPKQEFFAQRYKNRLKCKVVIGIGGSFDVWSGTLKRAPQFYIDHNVEWLYRLIQEPKRIKRISKLPVFLLKVAVHKEK